MEQHSPRPTTPFDNLVTPSYLYTLKLLLPYTPPSMQRIFAFFIKLTELQYTMEHFRGFPSGKAISSGIIDDLKPYMEPAEREMMEQMESMMNIMEMMQGMQAMSESSPDSSGFDPMDMMKGMLSPDQQDMFDMYSHMFDDASNHPDADDQKGES